MDIHFLFETADGEDLTVQRDFARHGHIGVDFGLCKQRDKGSEDGRSCTRAFFADSSFGPVPVCVSLLSISVTS